MGWQLLTHSWKFRSFCKWKRLKLSIQTFGMYFRSKVIVVKNKWKSFVFLAWCCLMVIYTDKNIELKEKRIEAKIVLKTFITKDSEWRAGEIEWLKKINNVSDSPLQLNDFQSLVNFGFIQSGKLFHTTRWKCSWTVLVQF